MRTTAPLAAVMLTALAAPLVSLALTPPATSVNAAAPAADNAQRPDLAFLTGRWRADFGGSVMDEYWFPAEHGSTSGVLRWTNPDGSHRMLEIFTIAPAEDGRTEFRLRHFHGDLEPWEAEKDAGPMVGHIAEHGPDRIRIAMTGNARDVATMTYEKTADDTLRVTISFAADSQRDPLVIEFARAP